MDSTDTQRALRRMGERADRGIDLAEAALLLAALDRPRVSLERYRSHLDSLSSDVRAATRSDAAESPEPDSAFARSVSAFNRVFYDDYDYAGDDLTYNDVQNANLMRVIDRRRGLPVSLGILYIHVARSIGWTARGVNFPGHFLIRLDCGDDRALIDPFDDGSICAAPRLRILAKAALGADAELEPAYYETVEDRAILLRLQNNIKFRFVRAGSFERAARTLDSMLLIAPDDGELWYEAGLVNGRIGNLTTAITAIETFLDLAGGRHPEGHRAAALLQELKATLN